MLESRPTTMYKDLHDGLVVIVNDLLVIYFCAAQAKVSAFLYKPAQSEVSYGL